MTIRVWYNSILVRLGIREVLPSDYIRTISVRENNEPIVALSHSSNLLYDKEEKWEARNSVIEKLEKIAMRLKEERGLYIHLFELYRSPAKQQSLRDRHIALLKSQNPSLPTEEIVKKVDKRVASIGGGHQTGGAVDLTLCDSNGQPLDMGTKYDEFNALTPTHAKGLSHDAQNNRNILLKYMQQEGFVNYPNEWWHFCYGDKMWAAYANKKYAMYDIIETN